MGKLNVMGQDSAFKFTLTCSIIQRTGSGVHSASSCYWDGNRDQCLSVQYPKKARTHTKMIAIGNFDAQYCTHCYTPHFDF